MFRLIFYIIAFTAPVLSQSELSERYTTLDEIETQLNIWYDEFSENTDPYPSPGEEGIIYHHEIIGYSGVENLPIWAVKLTMNANLDQDKPKVLILGQCHAEEIYGVEIAMGLIDWLLHPIDHSLYYQPILTIMQNAEIWIVPTHNPEGLSVVHGWYDTSNNWNQDVYYRKNKYDANDNNIFDFVVGTGNDIDGVDLNRNYDFNWIFGDELYSTDLGCGANPSYIANYDYYRGEHAFSESEVVTIRDFVLEHNFLLSIAYHSSRSGCVAEKVIYPWEWTPDKKSPDFDIISRLGSEMTTFLPKEAESGYYASASSVSRRGNAHDWIYANTGCIQYLVEVGTENMQSSDIQIIDETVEKNIVAALHMFKRAAGTNINDGPEQYQITGIVTDVVSGEPLNAKVWIDELNGPMLKNRYSDNFGRYRRLLIEGTYTIHFDAFGYEPHEYTFVPSGSQITEYNVELQPLNQFNLTLDLDLPHLFDEELSIIISSEQGFQDIVLNDTNPIWILSEGEYDIFISSDNIYPEKFIIILDQNLVISKDIKWKSTIYYDDFLSLNNWNNQGWVLDSGILVSQSDFLYPNSSDLSLTSLFQISSGEYVSKLTMRYELEWEHDLFSIYSNSNSEYMMIGNLTGHDYVWGDKFFNLSLDQNSGLKLGFISDETLDYRGVEIDNITIFQKPDGECDQGDLNQNVLIDIVDIIMMVNFIMDENTTGFEFCLADLDLSETLDVSDIIVLVNMILEDN